MKCQKCKLIEMKVTKNDEEGIEFRCPQCNSIETITEIIEEVTLDN